LSYMFIMTAVSILDSTLTLTYSRICLVTFVYFILSLFAYFIS